MSAYGNKKKIVEEGIIENGSSLVIWSDNVNPPKCHVSFVQKGESFDEEKLMASYKEVRHLVNSFTYQAMPFGIAGIIGMLCAMKFFFGFL